MVLSNDSPASFAAEMQADAGEEALRFCDQCRAVLDLEVGRCHKSRWAYDEEHRLLEASVLVNLHGKSNHYIKPMIIFSIETAVRQGELLKIRYHDIDFSKCLLTFSKWSSL